MAISYFGEMAVLLAAWIVYSWVRNELSWMKARRFGREYGCEEPKSVENEWPGGVERYVRMLMSKKGVNVLDDHIFARYQQMGVGTYRMHKPFYNSIVYTSDPSNIQAILATQFNDYGLGPSRSQNMFELLGHGIFTADGDAWAHYRQQLKPQFSRGQISDLDAAEQHLRILYRALPQTSSEPADLLPLLLRFTMDVSTEFLFGKSVNSQTTALQSIHSGTTKELLAEEEFVEAISYAQEYIVFRLRFSKLWWLARSKRFLDACQTCKNYSANFVQSALSSSSEPPSTSISKREGKEEGSQKKEKYILLNDLTEETRNPTELRDQMLHLLLAGRDTTAALLAWTLLLLSRDSARYKKYREQYALNEASFVIARFLQKYERIEAVDTDAKPKKKLSLTLSPSDKLALFKALLKPIYSRKDLMYRMVGDLIGLLDYLVACLILKAEKMRSQ
ncbi:hypothetical protein EYC80_005221 [Monilinia laxa]|uniref:Cytochrome P450 n=1 Tax=Monilinia laxa TaxID=61186 RepID=A0A5N6KJ78_MONLA|nr:hypothetical protein EYC80_005221 [Monilinia laxa]